MLLPDKRLRVSRTSSSDGATLARESSSLRDKCPEDQTYDTLHREHDFSNPQVDDPLFFKVFT